MGRTTGRRRAWPASPSCSNGGGSQGKPLARSRVYDYIGDPTFADAVLDGDGGKLWLVADVDAWMRQHAGRAGWRGARPRHLHQEWNASAIFDRQPGRRLELRRTPGLSVRFPSEF
jgi:hypothetical protein